VNIFANGEAMSSFAGATPWTRHAVAGTIPRLRRGLAEKPATACQVHKEIRASLECSFAQTETKKAPPVFRRGFLFLLSTFNR
jgi:hypothetical protein